MAALDRNISSVFILTHLALSSASSLGLGGAFLFSNSRCHQRLAVVMPPLPSGFLPPYRSTGHAFAGITLASRRPHERDEKLWAAGFSPIVWRSCPSPSGFQRRIGVRGVLLIAGMTRWAAGAYPGSWSGTCFHSNRPCRLLPAYQGMKTRSRGLVQ